MKRTQNNEFVLTQEELTKIQQNAYLDGAIAMVDSMRDNILKNSKLEDPEAEKVLEVLFDKSKSELLKAKNNK